MLILAVNRGSSSLKFALFEIGQSESLVLKGELERVGLSEGIFRATDPGGATLLDQQFSWQPTDIPRVFVEWLSGRAEHRDLGGIGHRVVQGGNLFVEPQFVGSGVLTALAGLVPLAPEHLSVEIGVIETFENAFPHVPQVACFDTAFHRRMPPVARTYALPPEVGVVRYGFHGLSYEFILEELRRVGERAATDGRVILAHLGNGCSMSAVRHGVGIDTTMGFTPAGGMVMGTRCGDLDPGVMVYLLRERGLDSSSLGDLVNRRAGLLGVSGISSDMRELLAREHDNPRAALAVDLFCYQARKFLRSLATALSGVDSVVFTGGIGANAPLIRQRICDGMQFLGIRVDAARNDANSPVISPDAGAVVVRVITTDEELMIARHTYRVLVGQEDTLGNGCARNPSPGKPAADGLAS